MTNNHFSGYKEDITVLICLHTLLCSIQLSSSGQLLRVKQNAMLLEKEAFYKLKLTDFKGLLGMLDKYRSFFTAFFVVS